MSKDMIGSVVRAAVGVPQNRLDTLAKIASRFSVQSPKSRPEGQIWHAYIEKLMNEKLPEEAYLIGVQHSSIDLGGFIVDYDETIEEKLNSKGALSLIQRGDFLSEHRNLSPGMFKPPELNGVVRYKASAVSFNAPLARRTIEEWGRRNKKIIGGLKEGIDMTLATPLIKLVQSLPLLMFGECRYNSHDYSFTPSFSVDGDSMRLRWEPFKSFTLWSEGWNVLVLEEVDQLN